jgi:hypothetical protein
MLKTKSGAWIKGFVFVTIAIAAATAAFVLGLPRMPADLDTRRGALLQDGPYLTNSKSAAMAFPISKQKASGAALDTVRMSKPNDEDFVRTSSDEVSRLLLVGVMQIGEGRTQALIRTTADTHGRWLSVGEGTQNWQLSEIAGNSAVVETNGRRVHLDLYAGQSAQHF